MIQNDLEDENDNCFKLEKDLKNMRKLITSCEELGMISVESQAMISSLEYLIDNLKELQKLLEIAKTSLDFDD